MDRIRKALDLARLERAHGGPPPRLDRPRPAEAAEAIGDVPATAVDASAAPIVYVQTSVFTPSDADLERNRVLSSGATGPAAAAYRMLRTQVLQRMDAHSWRSIAVFSPGAEDGKTTTAINLAVSLASDRLHTVLLVDFDFKRPAVAASFGLAPNAGGDDALEGRAPVAQCLYHPEGFERLVLLPARATLGNSSEMLAGPTARKLVSELRARYPERIVIFDLPPVLNADDALSFAPLVECGLVVAAEGRTRRNDLLRTIELLNRTPIVGTVLNRASNAPSGY